MDQTPMCFMINLALTQSYRLYRVIQICQNFVLIVNCITQTFSFLLGLGTSYVIIFN